MAGLADRYTEIQSDRLVNRRAVRAGDERIDNHEVTQSVRLLLISDTKKDFMAIDNQSPSRSHAMHPTGCTVFYRGSEHYWCSFDEKPVRGEKISSSVFPFFPDSLRRWTDERRSKQERTEHQKEKTGSISRGSSSSEWTLFASVMLFLQLQSKSATRDTTDKRHDLAAAEKKQSYI